MGRSRVRRAGGPATRCSGPGSSPRDQLDNSHQQQCPRVPKEARPCRTSKATTPPSLSYRHARPLSPWAVGPLGRWAICMVITYQAWIPVEPAPDGDCNGNSMAFGNIRFHTVHLTDGQADPETLFHRTRSGSLASDFTELASLQVGRICHVSARPQGNARLLFGASRSGGEPQAIAIRRDGIRFANVA